jgi:hypothetical protein
MRHECICSVAFNEAFRRLSVFDAVDWLEGAPILVWSVLQHASNTYLSTVAKSAAINVAQSFPKLGGSRQESSKAFLSLKLVGP